MFCRILCFTIIVLFWSCGRERPETDPSAPLFQQIRQEETGISFKFAQSLHPNDVAGISSGGGGVAAGDINNDGLPDLLFSGGIQNSGLYLNEGDFKFKDITQSAGIKDYWKGAAYSECVNFADVNGDGWLDIYITKLGIAGDFKTGKFSDFGANLLFINNGISTLEGGQKGVTFTEAGKEYGLDLIGQSIAAHFFDADNDGDLDVYVIQGAEPGSSFNFAYYEKKPAFKWFRDMLMENRDGRFVDITDQAGILNRRSIGQSVTVSDVNNDGFQDIYVANDFFGRDFFYLNNGISTLEGGQRGVTFREAFLSFFTKSPMSSMGSDFGDVDDDGFEDLFVGEMMPATYVRQKTNMVPFTHEVYERCAREQAPQYPRNMLSRNFAGKKLRDLGFYAGVYATEWSWSSFFFDADLDGRKDLFIANGIRRDMTNMDFVKSNFGEVYTEMANPVKQKEANLMNIPSVATSNFIFRNIGDFRFAQENQTWGISEPMHTRGATYADLDDDGDLDLIWNNLDTPPAIFKNMARETTNRNYLKLRLKGSGRNSFGIGARAEIRNVDGSRYFQSLKNQRGFQSTPEPVILFGLGEATKVDTLILYWPSGKKSCYLNLPGNRTHILEEDKEAPWRPAAQSTAQLFEATDLIRYHHPENAYNDFKTERLIPRAYSKMGPNLAVGDLNQDQRPDLYITGAGGKPGLLLLQTTSGQFLERENTTRGPGPRIEECAAAIFDFNSDGKNDLFLSYGSNEPGILTGKGFYEVDINGKASALPLPGLTADPDVVFSTAAHADIDGDGDQDLFLGGLLKPGKFGIIPESYLFLNKNGQFVQAGEAWSKELAYPGMVRKALFADVNNDNRPDLILAGEWMGIQVFVNQGDSFVKQEVPDSKGLWNTIEPADLDGDGDIDFVAGNLGRNQLWRASSNRTLTLLSGDFDKNGQVDPVVFYHQDNIHGLFPNRDLFAGQMPVMNKKYWSFSDFAKADFGTVFTPEERAGAKSYEVTELETCLLMNESGNLVIKRLPVWAQSTNCEAVQPYDFNGDGRMDLLLAGNSNQQHYEYGDMDASEGLLLFGQADGSFQVVHAGDYGLDLSGFVRDLVILELNGGPFLIVANNSGVVQSYKLRN